MTCTHPVLYTNAQGQLYCHLCGFIFDDKTKDDKPIGQDEKPAEKPKKGRKKEKA